MYELLKKRIGASFSNEDKINKTREYLQSLALKIIFDRQHFKTLAFVGGTALRVLFGLRKYSEDLDFSLIQKSRYSFTTLLNDLTYEIEHYGLKVETTKNESGVIHKSMVKFPDLLAVLGLSSNKGQKLSIKLEIDTNPPGGWATVLTPVSEPFVFAVKHFDLPSLFATKIHACFFRHYTKGRDLYDLVWYLGKKIKPNYILLNNAIKQTEKKNLHLGPENLNEFMTENLTRIDFNAARKDVERFLEDKNELRMIEKNILIQLLP